MNIVIGLIGPKTCGKSTVTAILDEFYNVREAALADKLKNVSAEVFGMRREQLDRQDMKEVDYRSFVKGFMTGGVIFAGIGGTIYFLNK